MTADSIRTGPAPRHRASRTRQRIQACLLLMVIGGVYGSGYARTAPARQAVSSARPAAAGYRDGTFTAWGRARHGRILATVVVRRGRIASAVITDCRMKYPCAMIADLPPRVSVAQGTDVDLVSGATNSSEAFVRAVDAALQQASRQGTAP